jgi:Gpi18-like mannosyltransferase
MKPLKDVQLKAKHFLQGSILHWPFVQIVVITLGILLALLLRFNLRLFESMDYLSHVKFWYHTISEQGIESLGMNISDYTPPYLYLLYIISKLMPHLEGVIAIKIPATISDLVMAGYAFAIVRLKYKEGPVPLLAFFMVLFVPTVVLNSSYWGQIDSLYTTALVACIYYVLKEKKFLAGLAFGIAFAIKLQSFFLAPFIVVLWLKKRMTWKELFLIPGVYLLAILPAWILGQSFLDLISIYIVKNEICLRLVHNAPTLYNWLPQSKYAVLFPYGLALFAGMCYVFFWIVQKSRVQLSKPLIIQLALTSVLVLPYFLPKMHDRNFFPADVISILFGFFFPNLFIVPLIVNLTSYFSYQNYFLLQEVFPQSWMAALLLVAIIIVIQNLFITLYPPIAKDQPSNPTALPG